jgi:hypothetical protein
MTGPDPIRDLVATMFHDLAVVRSRGGYTLVDPHGGTPLARLKPIPQSDRFELLYWSAMRDAGAPSVTSDHSPSSGQTKCSATNQSFTATPKADPGDFSIKSSLEAVSNLKPNERVAG